MPGANDRVEAGVFELDEVEDRNVAGRGEGTRCEGGKIRARELNRVSPWPVSDYFDASGCGDRAGAIGPGGGRAQRPARL